MFPNARLCKAMLDRLTDQAHIIETGSESYRFRTRRPPSSGLWKSVGGSVMATKKAGGGWKSDWLRLSVCTAWEVTKRSLRFTWVRRGRRSVCHSSTNLLSLQARQSGQGKSLAPLADDLATALDCLCHASPSRIRQHVISQGLVAEISGATLWRWLSTDALRPWQHRS